MNVETIDTPSYWAPALINRDESSLSESEAALIKEWVRQQGLGWPVSVSDSFTGRYEGLITEMATYSFLVSDAVASSPLGLDKRDIAAQV